MHFHTKKLFNSITSNLVWVCDGQMKVDWEWMFGMFPAEKSMRKNMCSIRVPDDTKMKNKSRKIS